MGQRRGGGLVWGRHLLNGLVASFEAGLTLTHFPAPQTREACEKPAASCTWRVAWSLLHFGSFVLPFKDLEGCFNYVPLRVLRAIAKSFWNFNLISVASCEIKSRCEYNRPHLSQLIGQDRLVVAFES